MNQGRSVGKNSLLKIGKWPGFFIYIFLENNCWNCRTFLGIKEANWCILTVFESMFWMLQQRRNVWSQGRKTVHSNASQLWELDYEFIFFNSLIKYLFTLDPLIHIFISLFAFKSDLIFGCQFKSLLELVCHTRRRWIWVVYDKGKQTNIIMFYSELS